MPFMGAENTLMKAGNLQRVCELTTNQGTVLVEPYAIAISAKGRRELLCYHLADEPAWRTIEMRFITAVRMLDATFKIRTDYDPFDRNRFPVMHYSVATHDGRQRWADKPSKDKTAEFLRPHIE